MHIQKGYKLKYLLLTDIPPCKNYTGGLVLDQLSRFVSEGSLCCVAVVHPGATNARLSEDLNWIPIKYIDKPNEYWVLFSGKLKFINKVVSFFCEAFKGTFTRKRIQKQISAFAKQHSVTALWAVMEGQTVIRIAYPLAKELNIPLFTEIWDPPQWWLKEHGVDDYTQKRILQKFEDALRYSDGCYAASWAMAEEFSNQYGTRMSVFLPSLEKSLAQKPSLSLNNDTEISIGVAGVLYSSSEWQALLNALDSCSWRINDRKVVVKLLTREVKLSSFSAQNIQYFGFRPQAEAIDILSECDVLYCPYWFDSNYQVEARLSFPSKITTYFAAGRPVFFHGPRYSSPYVFLENNDAAFLCDSLDTENILAVVTRIISEPQLYSKYAMASSDLFNKHFTLESLKISFTDFLRL